MFLINWKLSVQLLASRLITRLQVVLFNFEYVILYSFKKNQQCDAIDKDNDMNKCIVGWCLFVPALNILWFWVALTDGSSIQAGCCCAQSCIWISYLVEFLQRLEYWTALAWPFHLLFLYLLKVLWTRNVMSSLEANSAVNVSFGLAGIISSFLSSYTWELYCLRRCLLYPGKEQWVLLVISCDPSLSFKNLSTVKIIFDLRGLEDSNLEILLLMISIRR